MPATRSTFSLDKHGKSVRKRLSTLRKRNLPTSKTATSAKVVTKVTVRVQRHPTYESLVWGALADLKNGRQPISIARIRSWVVTNYPSLSHSKVLDKQIKRGAVANLTVGRAYQVRNSLVLRSGRPRKSLPKKMHQKKESKKVSLAIHTAKLTEKSVPKTLTSKDKKNADSQSPSVTDFIVAQAAPVSTITVPRPQGLCYDHLWQFHHGHWQNYEVNASDAVEAVYRAYILDRAGSDVRSVKSGYFSYSINFLALSQTNVTHPNHTVRSIRRVRVE